MLFFKRFGVEYRFPILDQYIISLVIRHYCFMTFIGLRHQEILFKKPNFNNDPSNLSKKMDKAISF